MNAIWTYDGGYLVARNKGGELLRKWSADNDLGCGLATLFDKVDGLSRLLLVETETMPGA